MIDAVEIAVTRCEPVLARGISSYQNQNCCRSLMVTKGTLPPSKVKLNIVPNDLSAKSRFTGKVIRQISEGNPRREGSRGHRSFDIIIKCDGELTYEAYRLMGGRPQDLQWDLEHGYVDIL